MLTCALMLACSCNPSAIEAELSWHGRQGGWRVYLRDMLRVLGYVMALPGVASLTEHYGQNKTELHLIASTGELHPEEPSGR